ncbi:hypothetical protein ACFE04_030809 [Oxalis oulophora]
MTQKRRVPRNFDGGEKEHIDGNLSIFTYPSKVQGRVKARYLNAKEIHVAHTYVVLNCPEIHDALPRFVLHLYDEDLSVRQACRSTLERIALLREMEGSIALLNTPSFNSDHRGDYEGFVRDLTRKFIQQLPSRVDSYMASTIQAFDSTWQIIQANAIHFSSCMLSLFYEQTSVHFFTQVFGFLVGKMSRSGDVVVRAACYSALGLLLKSTSSRSRRSARLESSGSKRRGQES